MKHLDMEVDVRAEGQDDEQVPQYIDQAMDM
jgi:hypothetical protein